MVKKSFAMTWTSVNDRAKEEENDIIKNDLLQSEKMLQRRGRQMSNQAEKQKLSCWWPDYQPLFRFGIPFISYAGFHFTFCELIQIEAYVFVEATWGDKNKTIGYQIIDHNYSYK
ncbi:hypothetical protein HELRODRAFT_162086 [Helobdella robusta]|uniref:Uncharacterized protein n=1 Tax=Helobdella robusta TaxID=6412 RepID=T1ES86_HELRO|nr:hypothetical protein HELRODRAFT_162086 [Helobdella robusta]ESN98648.1 hypothetical protein HELRODRAFT_162086 [Helobdella robusta]